MMNENDLQKIVDAVTERLRAEFDLVPKVKPAEPEPERWPFFCEKCKATGLWTRKEIEAHQADCARPGAMEQAITTVAMKHEAAFKPTPSDRGHYRLCTACRREFLTIESFNAHACAVAGRVLPVVLHDPNRPGQAERTADAMKAERKKAILAEATQYLNHKI